MAIIIIKRTCPGGTFGSGPNDPVSKVEWQYDTNTKTVDIVNAFVGFCQPFQMALGTVIEEYCDGNTKTVVKSDGDDGFTTTTTPSDPSCCSLTVFATVETGTNANTKKLVLTITGNAPPYQQSIGVNSPPVFDSLISNPADNQHIVDNIGAGTDTYNYRITDSNGCIILGFQVVNNQPVDCSGLSINASALDSDNGANNGQVLVAGNGGTPPYQYSLDGGAFTGIVPFTGLSPNTYSVTVRDANNCEEAASVVVGEKPGVPPGMFDPNLIISDSLPYRFVLIKANPNEYVYDNVLFNEENIFAVDRFCFEQLLDPSDVISVHIFYLDNTYNTLPKMRVKNANDDSVVSTFDFIPVGDNFYQLEEAVPVAAQNLSVYFTIVSNNGADLFEHARSEVIKVKERPDSLVIEYSNDSDYNNIKYDGNAYKNRLRIPVINFWEESLEEDSEIFELSESDLKLYQNTKKIRKLRVNFTPDYLHDRIRLALSHDNVVINNVRYVHGADYEYSEYKISQRVKTAETVLIDQNYNKTTVIS